MTRTEIQERYPFPRAYHDNYGENTRQYCVGGAVVKTSGLFATGLENAFPGPETLARALMAHNPALPAAVAGHYAKNIAYHNDFREFALAWDAVDEALRWPAL